MSNSLSKRPTGVNANQFVERFDSKFLEDLFGGGIGREMAEIQCENDPVCSELSGDERESVIWEQGNNITEEIIKPYEDAAETLVTTGNILADLTPLLGDGKAFVEAQDTLDYSIALIGVIPGVGDTAAALLRQAMRFIPTNVGTV